ncbi:MAG TPA: malic enzyme-like NAD(P)-binding protein [Phycisphaerae bacterium]|nr:malic enzyme-like NAD(P)-binding protein [Phycisphaerae bacterium]
MAASQGLQDRFGRNAVFSLRVRLAGGEAVGGVASLAERIGAAVTNAALVDAEPDGKVVYDLTLLTTGDAQMEAIRKAVAAADGVEVLRVLDVAMESHRGGACEMRSRCQIKSNTDLRIVYTPGVARVCKAVQADPAKAREYTNIANKVAIVTNGTAVLGLGDIGALAGLPVMEGKSAIFWEFARISAEPILIDTHDAAEFIGVCEKLAVGFGAIQVEDVAAPACFAITRELDRRLNVPVMHDDQHGTATVVLAGLYSALKKTGRKITDVRCAISGAGAAGTAIADVLMGLGMPDVVLCDRVGAIHRGRRQRMNPEKLALSERTNKDNVAGTLADAMKGRELFIGVSEPDLVTQEMVRSMAADPIVFALANPVSEISLAEAYEAGAAVAADGRMMNNALAYPGMFRGALDAAAESITLEMLRATAQALADCVRGDDLMPEMMDPATHQAVAKATREAAGPGTPLCT